MTINFLNIGLFMNYTIVFHGIEQPIFDCEKKGVDLISELG